MAKSKAQLISAAQASASKSEGMRLLYQNDFTVAEVKEAMGVPYGFAYGVAVRGNFVTPEARVAKAAIAKETRAVAKAKAAAKPAAKAAPAAPKSPAKPATKAKAK